MPRATIAVAGLMFAVVVMAALRLANEVGWGH